jgi:hypothetical protein
VVDLAQVKSVHYQSADLDERREFSCEHRTRDKPGTITCDEDVLHSFCRRPRSGSLQVADLQPDRVSSRKKWRDRRKHLEAAGGDNQVLDRSQMVDSKDGEMSEWLSAYAAKALNADASGGG